MLSLGNTISSYRRQFKMSQEKLAGLVGVSSTAVSKWERNVSVPDIDMLCHLADLFEISVDRLLGRNYLTEETKFEDRADADRYYIGRKLIESCYIVREKGLLAVVEYLKQCDANGKSFLTFCADFYLKSIYEKRSTEESVRLLKRYATHEKNPGIAEEICEIMMLICSGENEAVIKEEVKAFVGRKYAHLIENNEKQELWKMNREEAIKYYSHYDMGIEDTGILECFTGYTDIIIQKVLKCIEIDELLYAIAGASVDVRKAFMRNLSDMVLMLLGENMVGKKVEIREITEVQKHLADLGREFSFSES